MLVERDRNLDLKQALELAAEVQHIKVDASTIDDVRAKTLLEFYHNLRSLFLWLPL